MDYQKRFSSPQSRRQIFPFDQFQNERLRDRLRKNLNRDLPIELCVCSTVHLSHAALSKLGGDFVAGDGGSNHGAIMDKTDTVQQVANPIVNLTVNTDPMEISKRNF